MLRKGQLILSSHKEVYQRLLQLVSYGPRITEFILNVVSRSLDSKTTAGSAGAVEFPGSGCRPERGGASFEQHRVRPIECSNTDGSGVSRVQESGDR